MTNYDKLLEKLYSLNRVSEIKWNLDDILKLAAALDFPYQKFPSIHVAGSNGKGSVCTKLAETLRLSGYCVGLFTSPHLFSYRERFTIDGALLSQAEVEQDLKLLFSLAEKLKIRPKFFELTTLLAFLAFARHEVDVAVIETGLGGRLDATNLITPILSVITSVDFDHQEILGSTLDAIAQEKAGIIKENVPLVLGQRAKRFPILNRAKTLRIPLHLASSSNDPEEENRLIASKALKAMPLSVTSEAEKKGLLKRPLCRYQVTGDVVIDVAHNPIAFSKLFKKVCQDFPQRTLHLFFALAKDKDIEGCVKEVLPYASYVHLFTSEHPRLMRAEKIANVLQQEEFYAFSEGLNKERIKAERAVLVVAGSFYMMEGISSLLQSVPLHQTSCESHQQKDKIPSLHAEPAHSPFQ